MKPDRTNFEEWAIDWIDGNLDPVQENLFESFLDLNPDLKDELEILTSCKLTPEINSYTRKNDLKKASSDIVNSQFDLLCIASLENDLTSIQQKELEEAINSDSERKKQHRLVLSLKLIPPAVSYKNKRKLYKLAGTGRTRRITLITMSVAASAAAILFLFSPIFKERHQTDIQSSRPQSFISDTVLTIPEKILPDIPVIAESSTSFRPLSLKNESNKTIKYEVNYLFINTASLPDSKWSEFACRCN